MSGKDWDSLGSASKTRKTPMAISETSVNNGVNVEALLGVREVLTETPEAAKFERRVSCTWMKGTYSHSIVEGSMDVQGILGMDTDIRNGFGDIKVTYDIDADATREEIEALVAQSQKRSAVYDIVTNPTNVTVEVD